MARPYLTLFRILVVAVAAAALAAGCVSSQVRVSEKGTGPAFKGHARVAVTPGKRQWVWKGTGIRLATGDKGVVLVSLEKDTPAARSMWSLTGLNMRAGEAFSEKLAGPHLYFTAPEDGDLDIGAFINLHQRKAISLPRFIIDVFVVAAEDEPALPELLRRIRRDNAQDPYLPSRITALHLLDPQDLKNRTDDALVDVWKTTIIYPMRADVVAALVARRAVDALSACYNRYEADPAHYETRDFFALLDAFARLKDPSALTALNRTRYLQDPVGAGAFLKTLSAIGSPKAIATAEAYTADSEPDVVYLAVETMGRIAAPADVGRFYPLLLNDDPEVRWRAIQALGRLGNADAVPRLSVFLADADATVRGVTRVALRALDVSDETIATWQQKAQNLSIEDAHRSKLALQKAVMEKERLEKRLESEKDVKRRIAQSLEEKEAALRNQEAALARLYEKERQLSDMKIQLEQAQLTSQGYRKEMAQLERQAAEISKAMKKPSSAVQSGKDQAALETVMAEKARLEGLTAELQRKEATLRGSYQALDASTAQMRKAAEAAEAQVARLRDREAELVGQVEALKKKLNRGMVPVVVVTRPQNGAEVEGAAVMLNFVAVDDRGIASVAVTVNGQRVAGGGGRGIAVAQTAAPAVEKKVDYAKSVPLMKGRNTIEIAVVDTDGMSVTETLTVDRQASRGNIWAAVVGINAYEKVRPLKYAVNDATAFKAYLHKDLGVPEENIFMLLDAAAGKSQVQSLLGTRLKKKARPEDTVFIYYAGHGGVETDPANPDGDGFEKYLLPYDADLEDLYSTAISMKEVRTIFQRIAAERIIFIADTCYSGASGGRTMLARSTRATLSERFLDRLAKGKGRVILSASSANEVSQEIDAYRHGVFTYYLLEGLKGGGDKDGDGLVTVGEVFSYVSQKVPEATGQDQHPVKKGEVEGELVVGRVR